MAFFSSTVGSWSLYSSSDCTIELVPGKSIPKSIFGLWSSPVKRIITSVGIRLVKPGSSNKGAGLALRE